MTAEQNQYFAHSVPFSLAPGSAAEQAVGQPGPLTTRLKADLTAAIKAGDAPARSALRTAIAALQNAEAAGGSARSLTGDDEAAVLAREVGARRESAQACAAAGRPDLAARESAEADVLVRYLPQPPSSVTGKSTGASEHRDG